MVISKGRLQESRVTSNDIDEFREIKAGDFGGCTSILTHHDAAGMSEFTENHHFS
jgi:hypothetical protein